MRRADKISAATTENQMPSSPQNRGKIITAAIWNTSVCKQRNEGGDERVAAGAEHEANGA